MELGNIHTVNEYMDVDTHLYAVKWYWTFLRNMDEAETALNIALLRPTRLKLRESGRRTVRENTYNNQRTLFARDLNCIIKFTFLRKHFQSKYKEINTKIIRSIHSLEGKGECFLSLLRRH